MVDTSTPAFELPGFKGAVLRPGDEGYDDARLRALKAKWDPTNLFRHNQNIPPATAG